MCKGLRNWFCPVRQSVCLSIYGNLDNRIMMQSLERVSESHRSSSISCISSMCFYYYVLLVSYSLRICSRYSPSLLLQHTRGQTTTAAQMKARMETINAEITSPLRERCQSGSRTSERERTATMTYSLSLWLWCMQKATKMACVIYSIDNTCHFSGILMEQC